MGPHRRNAGPLPRPVRSSTPRLVRYPLPIGPTWPHRAGIELRLRRGGCGQTGRSV